MRFLCVVPSFNEEKTIGWIVKSAREQGHGVIVIDDGSRDQTARIARENGAEVIVNDVNLGKGASLQKAFVFLSGRDNYDAVIIMDGDGQHLPSDIVHFTRLYELKRPGVIVGNRMHKPKGMPLVRWLTNIFMSYWLSRKCRQHIPDTQCGFRLLDKQILKKINLATDNFEVESEMLLEAAEAGVKIESVAVASIYEGQYSAIHPVKDTLRFFRFLLTRKRPKP